MLLQSSGTGTTFTVHDILMGILKEGNVLKQQHFMMMNIVLLSYLEILIEFGFSAF